MLLYIVSMEVERMQPVTVLIDGKRIIALESEHTQFLRSFGEPTIRRASHVEPCNPALRFAFHLLRSLFGEHSKVADFTRQWPCLWRINMAPTGGPILPDVYRERAQAIAAEIQYFNEHISEGRF